MSVSIAQDLHFCLDILGLNDTQTDELLNTCENMGEIAVEYFCEEFIFEADNMDELMNNEHLNIAEFNAMYWEQ